MEDKNFVVHTTSLFLTNNGQIVNQVVYRNSFDKFEDAIVEAFKHTGCNDTTKLVEISTGECWKIQKE